MPMYDTCPDCGANNDPGERCDCGGKQAAPPPDDGRSCADCLYCNRDLRRYPCATCEGNDRYIARLGRRAV